MKNEFVKEVIDGIIETDFNPDIVLPAIEETYEAGFITGWWKGFGIGFGIPVACLTAFVVAYKYAKGNNVKEKKYQVIT